MGRLRPASDSVTGGVQVGGGDLAGVEAVAVRQRLQPDGGVQEGGGALGGVGVGGGGAGGGGLVAGDGGNEGGVVGDADVFDVPRLLDVQEPGDVDVEGHQAASEGLGVPALAGAMGGMGQASERVMRSWYAHGRTGLGFSTAI